MFGPKSDRTPTAPGCSSFEDKPLAKLGAVVARLQDAPPKHPDALPGKAEEGDFLHPPFRGLAREEVQVGARQFHHARDSESNWCFRISATVEDLGCGRKLRSAEYCQQYERVR